MADMVDPQLQTLMEILHILVCEIEWLCEHDALSVPNSEGDIQL